MKKILIADDEEIERRYLKKIIAENVKYKVIGEACNGRQVIDFVDNNNTDIIILDISMPLINGIEVSRIIKNKYPSIIIILNTAYANFEFAKKAIEYHVDGYILKPTSKNEIYNTIDNCYISLNEKIFKQNKIKQQTDNDIINNPIEFILDYVDKNYDKNICLKKIEEKVHLSQSYISKIFYKNQGIKFSEYLKRKRMEKAKYLLLNSNRTIKQISEDCGYLNVSHFNKVFKQTIRVSPMKYRNGDVNDNE